MRRGNFIKFDMMGGLKRALCDVSFPSLVLVVTVVAVRVGRLPDALPQVAPQGEGDGDGGCGVTLCEGGCVP